MTQWLARVLYQLAVWLHAGVEKPATLPAAQMEKAVALVRKAEQFAPGTTGEYKRAWAYGKLLKLLPAEKKSNVGLLIELAVQELQAGY